VPNKKSAEKRLRQADKARQVNRAVRSAIRTSLKKVRGAESKEEALKEIPTLFSLLDRAARRSQGNFKKNTASNYKRKAALVVEKLSA
jgi:small subunit ribosomal protein S20